MRGGARGSTAAGYLRWPCPVLLAADWSLEANRLAPSPLSMTLHAAAIARLCAWLKRAELPAPPLDTLPGVRAFDVDLLRRQVLHSVQVGDGDYTGALARLRYLAARYGPPELAALARPAELPQSPAEAAGLS